MEFGSSLCACARKDMGIAAYSWHSMSAKSIIPTSPGKAVSSTNVHLQVRALGGPRGGGDLKDSSTSSSKPGSIPQLIRITRDNYDHKSVTARRGVQGRTDEMVEDELKPGRVSIKSPSIFDPEVFTTLLQTVRKDQSNQAGRLEKYVESVGQVWDSKDLPSAICAAFESLITLMEPVERPPAADPAVQLADNFAPVPEFPPSGFCLEVEGKIPGALNGVYVRNGSNPQFLSNGGYHQFDGDGMLHALRIRDGQASYCCRYVQTHRFLEESKVGRSLFPKALGELYGMAGIARLGLFGLRKFLGVINSDMDGPGAANAGIAFHNGRLLAMSEDDMPYAVHIRENGDIETLGRLDFDGKLAHAMTAHPKVDPTTGEMFSFGYSVLNQPYLKYFRVSPEGKMGTTVPINRKEPAMVHDFVVTGKYAVFPEPQMVFSLERMIFNQESPIVIDEFMVPKVGIIPKYDADASRMTWFDMPGSCSCFHFVNGWDEEDEVVLVGSRITPMKRLFNDPAALVCIPTEFRVNLTTGQSSKKKLTSLNCDVGVINPLYAGRKNRFVYMSTSGPWAKFGGLVKLDLSLKDDGGVRETKVARRQYPPGCYGSEPFFVPRSDDPELVEDDGYVVTYIHDENTGVSSFLVMDARSPSLDIIASVKLPGRVPYGFHGIFLNEQQLSKQNPTRLYKPRTESY